jgi:hypothetical protein
LCGVAEEPLFMSVEPELEPVPVAPVAELGLVLEEDEPV